MNRHHPRNTCSLVTDSASGSKVDVVVGISGFGGGSAGEVSGGTDHDDGYLRGTARVKAALPSYLSSTGAQSHKMGSAIVAGGIEQRPLTPRKSRHAVEQSAWRVRQLHWYAVEWGVPEAS